MQTVYLLVDGLYYPGVFATREKAKEAQKRWKDYCGREAQIAHLTLDELASDKYASAD